MRERKKKQSTAFIVFQVINNIVLILIAILCIVPIVHVFSISLSSPTSVSAGEVILFPKQFTMKAYELIINDKAFWQSMKISLERVILGGGLGIFLTVITAYPLSQSSDVFKSRKYYVWFIFITMLFSGGLIPTFMVVYYTHLMNTIWALVIPGAISTWNIILMLNFFRQLPKEMTEAAFIDGAGYWTILWKIVLPLSKPVIATITLFTVVAQWNSWFDGMLYMSRASQYPLQTYLQSMLSIDAIQFLTSDQQREMSLVSSQTLKAAQIFIGSLPILIMYPFLQKYFTKGLVMGSVKG